MRCPPRLAAPAALRRGVGPASVRELSALETAAPLLSRTTGGAFDDPAVRAAIARHHRKTILLAGASWSTRAHSSGMPHTSASGRPVRCARFSCA